MTTMLVFYKMCSLFVGLAFGYMGYRLFMAGIWGNAGSAEGVFGNNKVLIKRAAPGTFFAIAGAVIVGLSIIKGVEFENMTLQENNRDKIRYQPTLPATPPKLGGK